MEFVCKRNRGICYVPVRESKVDVWLWFEDHPFASLCAKCAVTALSVWLLMGIYFLR